MEAKDTVKSRDELRTYLTSTGRGHLAFTEEELREAQAEISFKAGIREVVEWLNDPINRYVPTHDLVRWQAQKKRWGIK